MRSKKERVTFSVKALGEYFVEKRKMFRTGLGVASYVRYLPIFVSYFVYGGIFTYINGVFSSDFEVTTVCIDDLHNGNVQIMI